MPIIKLVFGVMPWSPGLMNSPACRWSWLDHRFLWVFRYWVVGSAGTQFQTTCRNSWAVRVARMPTALAVDRIAAVQMHGNLCVNWVTVHVTSFLWAVELLCFLKNSVSQNASCLSLRYSILTWICTELHQNVLTWWIMHSDALEKENNACKKAKNKDCRWLPTWLYSVGGCYGNHWIILFACFFLLHRHFLGCKHVHPRST